MLFTNSYIERKKKIQRIILVFTMLVQVTALPRYCLLLFAYVKQKAKDKHRQCMRQQQ